MAENGNLDINPKVAAGGVAGAVTIILVWILNTGAGVDVPPEVASAITTVLSFAAGYMMPSKSNN